MSAHTCDDSDIGYGVDMEAMYFGTILSNAPDLERLLVVGNRTTNLFSKMESIETNLVFELDPETGAVRHTGNKDPDISPNENEASANAWAVGRILIGPELSTVSFGNFLGAATSTHPRTNPLFGKSPMVIHSN